uniref:Putative zinc-finger associated domain protein n=1 Tax=Lutzomyia longipalpis TaxID=7200 RepID=A0A1B0GJ19_LUTLO
MQCRLCLVNIKDAKDCISCAGVPEMAEIVKTTLDISMDENANFPQTICVKCYQITVEYFAFRMRCVENQRALRIRQGRKRKADDGSEVELRENAEGSPRMWKSPKAPKNSRSLRRKITEHKLKPSRVVLHRLTDDDIAKIKMRLRRNRYTVRAGNEPTGSVVNPLDDHNYFGKPPENSVEEKDAPKMGPTVRTYCRASSSSTNTSKETATPQLLTLPIDREAPAPEVPRLKVLSSDEINSRAAEKPKGTAKESNLTCMLRLESGRLEIMLADEEQNVIDFWSITEQQRLNILSTFKPERVHQNLAKAFAKMPITQSTEKKLRHLYAGKIPFKVIVRD